MSEDAHRFVELDEEVQDFLRKIRPEEVETLTYLSRLPKDEIRGMLKFFRDMRAVGWWMRWTIISAVAVFIGVMTLAENIGKAIAWFRGSP